MGSDRWQWIDMMQAMKQQVSFQKIKEYLEERLPANLELLRQMVAINSFTANPTGVNAVGDVTAATFTPLGFTADCIQAANPAYGKHLMLTRTAVSHPAPKIALISHLDTVYTSEEERENDFLWEEANGCIYGPGTYDIKGGTIMMLMVLSAIKKFFPDIFNNVTWILAFNAAEEALVRDFGETCYQYIGSDALAALVFEGGYQQGNEFKLVVARKGMARYRIEVNGRSAHAGTSIQEGASAILQLAEVIQRVSAISDATQELSVNIGSIKGGTVTNRVPSFAVATGELRAYETAVFNKAMSELRSINHLSTVKSEQDGYPCRVRVQVLDEWEAWPHNKGSEKLLKLWQETAVDLTAVDFNYTVVPQQRGGLSDGNYTYAFAPTIDGLGPAGGNAHCAERSPDGSKEQEYVTPDSFIPKAIINIAAIVRLVKQSGEITE